jgi:AcrR family transcriptional regulator
MPTKLAPKKTSREDILRVCIPMFAKSGFDGISMRDIAAAVGVTPAALYHHFTDKDSLYLSLINQTFTAKTAKLKKILTSAASPQERLEKFITAFANVLSKEKDFQRLIHWTLIESTDSRMQALADDVFLDLVCQVKALVEELKTPFDPNFLTVSIMGMVMFPFQAATAVSHIPGHRDKEHKNPNTLAKHLIDLLRGSFEA